VYLVDTNVISAATPSRPASAALVEWMDAHSDSLFLSVVTVAEIENGIAKLRREGATRKSADLAAWLETVLHLYADSPDCRRHSRSGEGARPRTGLR
jgi:toxin FitB